LGVDVRLETKVISQTKLRDGRTELTLSDGTSLAVDLYVPTFGVVPNSSYIPSQYLTSSGFVTVDDCLRIKGTKDIWAAGDIADIEWKQFKSADNQAAHVGKCIVNILHQIEPVAYIATPPSGRT
jgi:NADPH-dependent 2,4-dienoyl-CoA reductase/sulfur reductase-like enzyme